MSKIGKVYTPLILIIQSNLDQLSEPGGPVLFALWAGRGGGKTTILGLIGEQSSDLKATTTLGPWDFRLSPSEVLASQVLTTVRVAPNESRKLILLDNLDELLRIGDGEPFFTFEREVLRELVRRGDTLVVVTSRAPLIQWRDYEVRISARNLHIPSLSREDVAEWARERQLDPDQAFEISLGHPQVLAWLQEQPNIPPEEIDRKVADLFLNGISGKTRQLAEVASLFPVFDLAVLRPVLSAEDTESFYSEYTERLEELLRKGLVFWDGEIGAYRFQESTVRRLLARGALHRDPEQFRRIHQVAAGYYQQEAQRAAYLHRSLVSALYHTAQAHFGKREEAGKVCIQWIENTLGTWLGAPWEKVLRAWETGAGDEAIREELQALLGPAAFERITRLLESAAQAAAPIIQQVQEVNR
jgi:hypothetical protein